MKISLNSGLNVTEVHELEESAIEMIQSKTQREKTWKKMNNLRDLWHNMKLSNMYEY